MLCEQFNTPGRGGGEEGFGNMPENEHTCDHETVELGKMGWTCCMHE